MVLLVLFLFVVSTSLLFSVVFFVCPLVSSLILNFRFSSINVSLKSSDVPSDNPTCLAFEKQCNPQTDVNCFPVAEEKCGDCATPITCGSLDPCDACPSTSICQEGTEFDEVGLGNYYCVAW